MRNTGQFPSGEYRADLDAISSAVEPSTIFTQDG